MNRKQYTALAFALVGAAALSAQAVAAKDLTVAVYSAFTTLDPYDASDTLSQNVAKSFYEGLFGFDKDMKLVNVLAESYDVSKDGLEYTIKLKQGIKFPSMRLRLRRTLTVSPIRKTTSPAISSTAILSRWKWLMMQPLNFT